MMDESWENFKAEESSPSSLSSAKSFLQMSICKYYNSCGGGGKLLNKDLWIYSPRSIIELNVWQFVGALNTFGFNNICLWQLG